MARILILVSLAALITVALSESQCFQTFKSCMAAKKADADSKKESMKQKAQACFASDGCTLDLNAATPPPMGGDDGSDSDSDSQSSESHGFEDVDPQLLAQCKETMETKMKQPLLQCVQNKIPGFTFPEHPQEQQKPEGGFMNPLFVLQQANACNNKTKVFQCLKSIMEENRPAGSSSMPVGRPQSPVCQAIKECGESSTDECKSEFNNTKTVLRECAESLHSGQEDMSATSQAHRTEFFTCIGKQVPSTPAPSSMFSGHAPHGMPAGKPNFMGHRPPNHHFGFFDECGEGENGHHGQGGPWKQGQGQKNKPPKEKKGGKNRDKNREKNRENGEQSQGNQGNSNKAKGRK